MGKYYDQTAWLKNYRAKIKKKTHSLIYSSITEYHLRVKVEHTIQYIYLYIYILYSILVYIPVHIHTIQ